MATSVPDFDNLPLGSTDLLPTSPRPEDVLEGGVWLAAPETVFDGPIPLCATWGARVRVGGGPALRSAVTLRGLRIADASQHERRLDEAEGGLNPDPPSLPSELPPVSPEEVAQLVLVGHYNLDARALLGIDDADDSAWEFVLEVRDHASAPVRVQLQPQRT